MSGGRGKEGERLRELGSQERWTARDVKWNGERKEMRMGGQAGVKDKVSRRTETWQRTEGRRGKG